MDVRVSTQMPFILVLFLIGTILPCLGQIINQKIELFTDVVNCHAFIENGLIYVSTDENITYTAEGVTNTLCNMGGLNTSITCLEHVYLKWHYSSSQMETLQQLAISNKWKQGIDYFCKSLPGHSGQDKCVQKLRPTIKNCLSMNKMAFDKKLTQYTQTELDKIMFTMCLYYEGNRRCTANPIMDSCDKRLANIIGGLIHSYMPYICNHPSKLKSLLLMPSDSVSRQGHSLRYIFAMILVTYILGKF